MIWPVHTGMHGFDLVVDITSAVAAVVFLVNLPLFLRDQWRQWNDVDV